MAPLDGLAVHARGHSTDVRRENQDGRFAVWTNDDSDFPVSG